MIRGFIVSIEDRVLLSVWFMYVQYPVCGFLQDVVGNYRLEHTPKSL